MDISCIIPFYNAKDYINRCINHILNYDTANLKIEYIFIDDGSVDFGSEVIDLLLEHSDIDYCIINQNNLGVSAARNIGISKANGKYIMFLDIDDYYDIDTFKVLYNLAEMNNAEFAYGGYKVVSPEGKLIKKYNEIYFRDDKLELVQEFFNWKVPICVGSFIVLRELIKKNNIEYHNNCKYCEDYEFITKCIISSKKISAIKRDIYNYVDNLQSVMHKVDFYRFHMLDSIIRIREYCIVSKCSMYVLKTLDTFTIPYTLMNIISFLLINGYDPQKVKRYIDLKGYNEYLVFSSKHLKLGLKILIWKLNTSIFKHFIEMNKQIRNIVSLVI